MDEITSKYHSVDFQEPRRLRILVNWPIKARMSSLVSIEGTAVCGGKSYNGLESMFRGSIERLMAMVGFNYLCLFRSLFQHTIRKFVKLTMEKQ
jgi:hypothetical protein